MKTLLVILSAVLLTGCALKERVVQIKVPVPVKCKATVPTKPPMPTDAVPTDLPDDKLNFELLKAALAEIELREGYEDRLLAELESCL